MRRTASAASESSVGTSVAVAAGRIARSSSAGIGDFNGDGTSDVLWYNPTTHATENWIISNAHWAGSNNLGVHPGPATIAGIGDFNGGGTSDILWHQFV